VADASDPILPRAVDARTRLVVGEVVPRVAVGAVVLAHGPPLWVARVRAEAAPRDPERVGLVEAALLGRVDRFRPGAHGVAWLASGRGVVGAHERRARSACVRTGLQGTGWRSRPPDEPAGALSTG